MMTSAPLYVSGLSRSQAGIPKKVKFGPYILPIFVIALPYLEDGSATMLREGSSKAVIALRARP